MSRNIILPEVMPIKGADYPRSVQGPLSYGAPLPDHEEIPFNEYILGVPIRRIVHIADGQRTKEFVNAEAYDAALKLLGETQRRIPEFVIHHWMAGEGEPVNPEMEDTAFRFLLTEEDRKSFDGYDLSGWKYVVIWADKKGWLCYGFDNH